MKSKVSITTGKPKGKVFAYFVAKKQRDFEKSMRWLKSLKNFKKEELETYITEVKGKRWVLVGLGKQPDEETFRKAIAKALSLEKQLNYVPNKIIGIEKEIKAVTEGAVLYSFEFDDYKSKKKKENYSIRIITDNKKVNKIIKNASIVAESQNYARWLANQPPNIATPEFMLDQCKKLAKELKLGIKYFDKKKLKAKGMNTILAVNAGSSREAYIVHLTYKPKNAKIKVAIGGKGITFDTGGVGLKPSKYMLDMHLDKTGACSAMGIIRAVALLKLPIELHVVAGFTENAIGSKATTPASIVKSYSGKTVEIVHTDAEGRLVLADVMSYVSKDIKPDYAFDLATLTGAMSICLGKHAIGVFSNNEKLANLIKKAGFESGERTWPFPMWKEYGEMLKSDVADVKNLGSWDGDAGSITGAKFIENFVEVKRWAHLDIASMMDANNEYLRKGGIAPGVRVMVKTLEMLVS